MYPTPIKASASAWKAKTARSALLNGIRRQCEKLETCDVVQLEPGKLRLLLQTLAATLEKNRPRLSHSVVKRAKKVFMRYGWKVPI